MFLPVDCIQLFLFLFDSFFEYYLIWTEIVYLLELYFLGLLSWSLFF